MSEPVTNASSPLGRWRAGRTWPYFTLSAVLLAIMLTLYLIFAPGAGSLFGFNGDLRTLMPLMFAAFGATVVIISGGIDISIGALVCVCSAVAVKVISGNSTGPELAAGLVLTVLVGMTGGLLNAVVISVLRFQPIIATFGTNFVFGGLALVILPSQGGAIPLRYVVAVISEPLGISLTIVVAVVITALWGLVNRTRFHGFLYASGASQHVAYSSGVPVRLMRGSAYVIAGMFAGLAAVAMVSTTGTGDPVAGASLTLPAIVATVLGGTSFAGGRGGLLGTALAVFSLGLLQVLLSVSALPSPVQLLCYGLAIAAALSLSSLRIYVVDLVRKARGLRKGSDVSASQ